MPLSAQEQYFLELTNRARLDPVGEAERYQIGLNDNITDPDEFISGDAMEILAPNALLDQSAEGHSVWMLDTDQFQHIGANGTTAGDRMNDAGYDFTGFWAWAENLAWSGNTNSTPDLTDAINDHHELLFRSETHRVNTLDPNFREAGIAQVVGVFTSQGFDYNSSMLTVNFGRSGDEIFLTGVTYNDSNLNEFYDVGEGRGNVTFTMETGAEQTTSAAGGYGIGMTQNIGRTLVDIEHGNELSQVAVYVGNENIKMDLLGDDTLLTNGSVDLVSGPITDVILLGENDVTLRGNSLSNVFEGGRGADTLRGSGGQDTLIGNEGSDGLYGGTGDDIMRGGAGQDTMDGGDDNDTMYGGGSIDTMMGESGFDAMWGDAGNDIMNGGFGNDRIHGDDGDDFMEGSHGNDQLFGGAGNDNMNGQAGNDLLRGHAGIDILSGGSGDDQIEGQSGADQLFGGSGNDLMEGHVGRDWLYGGNGLDEMYGGQWVDNLYGGDDRDTMYGGQSNDKMWGDAGNDVLYGGSGYDRVHGNNGTDVLYGDGGNDQIFGGGGGDALYGGSGRDRLDGSFGNDTLTGGSNDDRFIFKINQGDDTVTDFSTSEGDRVFLDADMFNTGTTKSQIIANYTSIDNGNLIISTESGDTVTLLDVTTLTEADLGLF